jgi:DNA-directed RNA polymerase subunit RPC12/RpoP
MYEINTTFYKCGNCKHETQHPITYGNGTIACPKCKSKLIVIKAQGKDSQEVVG